MKKIILIALVTFGMLSCGGEKDCCEGKDCKTDSTMTEMVEGDSTMTVEGDSTLTDSL